MLDLVLISMMMETDRHDW